MAQILSPRSSGGEKFAAGLGSGISAALERLAAEKIQQTQQARQQKLAGDTYEKLGLPRELASAPQELQKSFFKEYFSRGGAFGQQTPEEQEAQGNLQQQQQQPSPRDLLQQAGQQEIQQMNPMQALQMVTQPKESLQGLQELTKLFAPEVLGGQKEAAPVVPEIQPQQAQITPEKQPKAYKTKKNIAEIMAQPTKKEQAEAKREARERQKNIDAKTQPVFDKISADKDFADFSDVRIGKMENLVKKGGLPISGLYSALKNLEEHVPAAYGAGAGAGVGTLVGGPVGGLIGGALGGLISPVASLLRSAQNFTSPNAEEFTKLSTEFIKGAKALFGARITNDELKAYLATIPTLANTDEGKLAIIKNMRIANKVARVKYNAMQKLIHENGGERPDNLQYLVDQRTKKEVDKLAEEFMTV